MRTVQFPRLALDGSLSAQAPSLGGAPGFARAGQLTGRARRGRKSWRDPKRGTFPRLFSSRPPRGAEPAGAPRRRQQDRGAPVSEGGPTGQGSWGREGDDGAASFPLGGFIRLPPPPCVATGSRAAGWRKAIGEVSGFLESRGFFCARKCALLIQGCRRRGEA